MKLDTSKPIASVNYNGTEMELKPPRSKTLASLTEGSLISVLEDGKLVPFYVAKHDYEADLNGEGRTLLVRKDLPAARVWHNSAVNAFATSDIAAWLNGDYKYSLSSIVQSQLGTTEFYYTAGNGVTTVSTLQRAVFMLSLTELDLTFSNRVNAEGSALPIASALRIAYLDGVAYNQWTRSPTTITGYVAAVNGNGASAEVFATNTVRCPRPCFTLPADMALNDEPYADGSWGLADEDVLFDTETAKTTPLAPVNYTNGIADLTPAQLDEIAKAISSNPKITKDTSVVYYDKGDVHRKISVGDQQNIIISGVSYAVNIIGFNHDDLAQSNIYGKFSVTGKAGMTIQMVECWAKGYGMKNSDTNVGGWGDSVMRNTYMNIFLNQNLPSEVVNVSKIVKKTTSAGNKDRTINTTEDKLFLLSSIEVWGSSISAFDGEGEQYAYYKAGNTKIKNLSNVAAFWWLRSPYSNDAAQFCCMNNAGSPSFRPASTDIGIAFAYCI